MKDMPRPVALAADLLDHFAAIVGPECALRAEDAISPYLKEPRDKFHGESPLVLRPGSTKEVSAILSLANETKTPIVPQGGNTGLVGGQIPDVSGGQVIVSLSRMNRVRDVDPIGDTMTVEAGVILADAQAAADQADRFFGLSLASEGSCEIGGNLSTNAGGTAVLAYGNTREQVLGLEVVLADGRIWDGLRKLRKDNTGYDLRDLFIGAEGTLGIITAAVLRLRAKPRGRNVALVGLANPDAALSLFEVARGRAGRDLTAFEIMPRIAIEAVVGHIPDVRDPLASAHPWYVLFEVSSLRSQAEAEAEVESIFTEAFDRQIVEDGVQARSIHQMEALWHIRHGLSEVQKFLGGSIKHDVAVPRASVPAFIEEAGKAVMAMMPGCRLFPFGHIGDGNIHYNVSQPVDMDKAVFLTRWEEVNAVVHKVVADFGGTISAEHGIGTLKRDLLPTVKSPVEMEMMRTLKSAFDPNGILNPNKVLADTP